MQIANKNLRVKLERLDDFGGKYIVINLKIYLKLHIFKDIDQ